eukprot:1627-Heterococcus_DN1.PRE.1
MERHQLRPIQEGRKRQLMRPIWLLPRPGPLQRSRETLSFLCGISGSTGSQARSRGQLSYFPSLEENNCGNEELSSANIYL